VPRNLRQGSMDAKALAEHIAGRGDARPKGDGSGGFLVRCPCHDDRDPSLHISAGKNGSVVLHCFADCRVEDILAAADLGWSDLFNDQAARRRPTAEYHYRNFTILRFGDGRNKTFAVVSLDKDGNPVSGARGLPRSLYHDADVTAAVAAGEPVWLTEGEKDCDAMRTAYGVTATTNPFGATAWARDAQTYGYAERLRGAQVVLVQHRDVTGRKRTRQVLASLAGMAASVRVVEAATGNDAHDHVAAGRHLDEFVEAAATTLTLIDDGTFIPLPVSFFEALDSCGLSHLEFRVALQVARHTVLRQDGRAVWPTRPLSSTWLARCAGNASAPAVRKAVERLREASIILTDEPDRRRPTGKARKLGINPDFGAWRPLKPTG
jgi:hypothetical protein